MEKDGNRKKVVKASRCLQFPSYPPPRQALVHTCHLSSVEVCKGGPPRVPRVDGGVDLYPQEPGGRAVPHL